MCSNLARADCGRLLWHHAGAYSQAESWKTRYDMEELFDPEPAVAEARREFGEHGGVSPSNAFARAIQPNTKVLYAETLGNPTLAWPSMKAWIERRATGPCGPG